MQFWVYSAIELAGPRLIEVLAAPFENVFDANLELHDASSLDSAHLLYSRGLPTGTCNAQTPCENAACCGTNGLCGYSPTEYGSGMDKVAVP